MHKPVVFTISIGSWSLFKIHIYICGGHAGGHTLKNEIGSFDSLYIYICGGHAGGHSFRKAASVLMDLGSLDSILHRCSEHSRRTRRRTQTLAQSGLRWAKGHKMPGGHKPWRTQGLVQMACKEVYARGHIYSLYIPYIFPINSLYIPYKFLIISHRLINLRCGVYKPQGDQAPLCLLL